MKYLIILAALLPITAFANEAQLACNLEQSKAEVTATVQAAPQAFGSVGQEPSSGEKSINAGVSQSFAGRSRATLIREAAAAKCDAIRSTVALDEHARWSVQTVKRNGALIELKTIEQAILEAKAHIAMLDQQLAAQVITINQHTDARQTLVSLENRQSELMRVLSAVVLPPPTSNVSQLIVSATTSEANAARLASQAQAETGWDVVVAAGVRQPLEGGQAEPFGSIGFKYSFGYSASKNAAAAVGSQTAALLAAQQGGYTQTVARQREELAKLIDAETLAESTSVRQLFHLQGVRASLNGIETALAQNTARALDIQLLILQAAAQGSRARLDGYKDIVVKLP
jgi:hypothetical protein